MGGPGDDDGVTTASSKWISPRGGARVLVRSAERELAMLNMLPIPVLDGGHILSPGRSNGVRKPVMCASSNTFQTGGAVLIIGFMVYIFYFDVHDWVADGGSDTRPKPVPVEVAKASACASRRGPTTPPTAAIPKPLRLAIAALSLLC